MTRMRRKAEPVLPIYQLQVAVDAVVYAAEHPQRSEYIVVLDSTNSAQTFPSTARLPDAADLT
ncbi:hypothetical protein AB0H00_11290 [Nocardia sp. NPDC023852]|uniref:hypothetical protein n=1 Tax=Nocardia sp. NPDC023852 TaxID=3154697 RepID=UPI0033EB4EE4